MGGLALGLGASSVSLVEFISGETRAIRLPVTDPSLIIYLVTLTKLRSYILRGP